jgi:uncharacterized heparinase superfamily protein
MAAAPFVASEQLARTVESFGPDDEQFLDRADRVMRGEFELIGHVEQLRDIDWRRRYVSHLWSYNLHYFDYARDLAWAARRTGNAAYAQRFTQLAQSWIAASSSGIGDGWEPYPLSLRVVNWIYAVLLMGERLAEDERAELTGSIYRQLLVLERRIEWHLMANHLQKNLHALFIGGLLFEGQVAARWRQRWGTALWAQALEQILPDGVHIERSPMYHAIALGDFLEAIALGRAAGVHVPTAATQRVELMAAAMPLLAWSSDKLHFFNDSANGVGPDVKYLKRLCEPLAFAPAPERAGTFALTFAGYYGHTAPSNGDSVIINCGEPGPRYQLGHAHCDLLSFELELGSTPIVVNSGVCGYDGDPLREYVRSTRAHNTVSIDGREQHELWGVFRVGRCATVRGAWQRQSATGEYNFEGSYSPYWSSDIQHTRCIAYDGKGLWTVTDAVLGARGVRLESYLHLHPAAVLEFDEQRGRISVQGKGIAIEFFGVDSTRSITGNQRPEQGWYCGVFGPAIAAPCIVATVEANTSKPFGYRIYRSTPGGSGS